LRHGFVKKTSLFLSLVCFMLLSVKAYADEGGVPIPPRRPDVLNVSPAYIQKLISQNEPAANHDAHDTQPLSDDLDNEFAFDHPDTELTGIEDAQVTEDAGGVALALDEDGFVHEIEQIDQNMVLAVLNEEVTVEDIDFDSPPIPQRKPVIESSKEKANRSEKALISFALNPQQINLDPMLKEFLNEYAIDMFRNDPHLKMEIFAYATPVENQEYSDVRRALARALEVRSYLLSYNIQASRLKINAVGQDHANMTDNRIDLVFKADKEK